MYKNTHHYCILLLISGLLLSVLSACQSQSWIYIRNQSSQEAVVEIELISGNGFAMPKEGKAQRKAGQSEVYIPAVSLPILYAPALLPIRPNTRKKLTSQLTGELITLNKVRVLMPKNSTLYLPEPEYAMSYEEIRVKVAKVTPDSPIYQYENAPLHSFEKGKGNLWKGYSLFFDIK